MYLCFLQLCAATLIYIQYNYWMITSLMLNICRLICKHDFFYMKSRRQIKRTTVIHCNSGKRKQWVNSNWHTFQLGVTQVIIGRSRELMQQLYINKLNEITETNDSSVFNWPPGNETVGIKMSAAAYSCTCKHANGLQKSALVSFINIY